LGLENDGRPIKVREKALKAQRVDICQAQFHPRAVRERTTILALRLISNCVCLLLEPRPHTEPAYADAKQVCWNKSKL
jgi:hypothetical protein